MKDVYSTGVNFTNFLWAAFAPKSFRQKITNPNCNHIKVAQKLSYKKAAHKILLKLTPGVKVIKLFSFVTDNEA